ncbi:hypothetical protein [Sorangium sp. So ce1182]|uniref:hypothetical protein n=1 Tax=Sorangium sp. So ce1182 TaxID=3133334 RepID=UPI003F5F33C3
MYKAEEQRVQDEKTRFSNEEKAFTAAVNKALDAALRPAFAEVAAGYTENGLNAEMGEGKPITAHGEKSPEARVAGASKSLISMRFQLIKGWRTPDFTVLYMPDIGIVVDKPKRRLVLYATNLRESSSVAPIEVASFDPATLTKDAVVDAVAEAITEINNIGRRP